MSTQTSEQVASPSAGAVTVKSGHRMGGGRGTGIDMNVLSGGGWVRVESTSVFSQAGGGGVSRSRSRHYAHAQIQGTVAQVCEA
uniref:Uncharacterized protein n=1 Tax=Knipowitschia caucasica TaxID=637954 RepID=A0AAV2LWV2_KNICA